ncbi:MAG: response regulator [Planctomycetota bacterium]
MHQSKILVADDSRSVRAVLRRTLSSAGYDVILASDGLEAVRSAQRDHPDLVILDIQMPHMDGYTACQEILALEESPNGLPIVFLTRDTAKHLFVLGTQLGAYLPKPVTDDTLLSTVSDLLAQRNGVDDSKSMTTLATAGTDSSPSTCIGGETC